MPSTIQIQGAKRLSRKLDKTSLALRKAKILMGQIGSYLSLKIGVRTAQGLDYEEAPFAPYSKSYAKVRREAGRPTKPVDLFFTGSMMNAMTYETQDQQVDLFFMNTTDKFGERNPLKAYFLQTHKTKPRVFFSISAKDIIEIEKLARAYINKHLKKQGHGRKQ